jgi:hypothetical protein
MKNGDADMGMELWRKKAMLDLSEQDGLEGLAKAGLRDRLRDFYSTLAKRAPGNRAIETALKKLER